MFELVIQSGKLQGKRLVLPVDKAIVVGRDEGCQIVLHSSLISRNHCELKHVADGIWVRDLGSQNGTYLNDVLVETPTLARHGDLLRIGACLFGVNAQVAPGGPPTARKTPPPPTERSAVSDAEIANWLTEGDAALEQTTTGEDTTIIRGARATPVSESTSTSSISAIVAASPATAKKHFQSVKEEAADIIRRYWEKVRSEQS